jgi:EpsG family
MLPYILMIIALGLAFLIIEPHRPSTIPVLCLVLLILFVGLRYEIGVDWLAYERLFVFVPDNFSLSEYSLSGSALQTEFLFYALVVFVKSIGAPFEALLFVMAAFNVVVIDKMCRETAPNSQPFVWLAYFCLAVGTVQFNIVRQALASSFVILSLLYAVRGRPVGSVLALGLGFGIHSSVLMFLPVLALVRFEPRRSVIFGVLGVSAALFVSGVFVGAALLNAVAAVLPGVIGSKAENYATAFNTGALFGISPLAMVLIFVYLYLLRVFLKAEQDGYIRTAIYLTLLVLFAHLALGTYPSFWNRVMCVSLPWQLAALWRLKYFERFDKLQQMPVKMGVVVALGSAMIFQLSRAESKPFVPYHSLLQVWVTGDRGDGRQRAIETIREAELQNAR